MKVMRRSRWLARLAAMLVVGVAGLVVAAIGAGCHAIRTARWCALGSLQ